MIPVSWLDWAVRHGVSAAAVSELRALAVVPAVDHSEAPGFKASESWAQSAVRLEAARAGDHLWRNNNGALADANGRYVRFGLANDSPALNKVFKSSDLIGIRSWVIQPHHVGYLVGQFYAREVKEPGWVYAGTEREVAQASFIQTVQAAGGDAAFTTGPAST